MKTQPSWRHAGAATLLALSLCTHGAAFAFELPGAAPQAGQALPDYQPQRLNEIFSTDKRRPMAAQWVRTNKLEQHLAALRVHAGNPALRFNSDAQQALARRDAIQLAVSLTRVTASAETPPNLLLCAAIALSVAHNLGAPEAAALADERFQRLLVMVPELPQGLVEYGTHLANTQRPNEALVPLRRALARGDDGARWPLAMSLAALGQRSEAVAELEALQARSADAPQRYPLATTLAALRSAQAAP